jgi:hypothetical protein
MKIMVTADANGARPLHPEEFAGLVLGPGPVGLPPRVEDFLLRARECMAYGGFHYPLITVGLGQLGLAAEAAVRAHAENKSVPIRKTNGKAKNMVPLVEELRAAGHLTMRQEIYWKAVADLRNFLFHPEECPVYPIASILVHLTTLTEALLELFPGAVFLPATETGTG